MRMEPKLRNQVLSRDENKCQICLKSFQTLEIHHIIPLKQGGTDSLENLLSVCRKCHNLIELSIKGRKKTGVTQSRTIRLSMATFQRLIKDRNYGESMDGIINSLLDNQQNTGVKK